MLTLRLVVREGDLKRKSQGFRGYKNWIHSPRQESQRGLMDAHSQACSQGERSPRKESQRGLRDAQSQTCSQGRRSKKKATRLQRI